MAGNSQAGRQAGWGVAYVVCGVDGGERALEALNLLAANIGLEAGVSSA